MEMDRVTSYAISDLPHAPSYRLPQLPVFQAKTRCSCPSCHDSVPTVGHSSRHMTPLEEESHHHRHHHHHHHHQTNMSSHLSTCTRTCFSQLASHLIPQVPAGSSCSCYSHVQHVPPTPPLPPPPPSAQYSRTAGGGCPCCQNSNAMRPNDSPHYHHVSRLHLASADNITNHPPHYADAFAPPPLLHASWEPTGGNSEPHRPQALRHVYISSPSPTHSSTQEFHLHTHHHQQIPPRRRPYCPVGPDNLRNLEHELHSLATRHYRRYSGRSSSFPYPSVPFHPTSEMYIREPLLRLEEPATIPISVPYFIEEEGEPAQLEYDWLEINGGRVSEPKGITKEMLAKLPSYVVTKDTLEDFNDSDRCVICMCEYEVDERLRVLPCAHEFHSECIDKWLTSNPTCPICRSIVEVT